MADDEEYKVGYCKPPLHSRFKSGVSGNPRGRPTVANDFDSLIERELNQKVSIPRGARQIQGSKRQAIAFTLVNDAAKGKSWARDYVLKYIRGRENTNELRLSPIDEDILTELAEMLVINTERSDES
ncbi:DUF5681 domain-containing protein [Methylobacterium sp. A54F]